MGKGRSVSFKVRGQSGFLRFVFGGWIVTRVSLVALESLVVMDTENSTVGQRKSCICCSFEKRNSALELQSSTTAHQLGVNLQSFEKKKRKKKEEMIRRQTSQLARLSPCVAAHNTYSPSHVQADKLTSRSQLAGPRASSLYSRQGCELYIGNSCEQVGAHTARQTVKSNILDRLTVQLNIGTETRRKGTAG